MNYVILDKMKRHRGTTYLSLRVIKGYSIAEYMTEVNAKVIGLKSVMYEWKDTGVQSGVTAAEIAFFEHQSVIEYLGAEVEAVKHFDFDRDRSLKDFLRLILIKEIGCVNISTNPDAFHKICCANLLEQVETKPTLGRFMDMLDNNPTDAFNMGDGSKDDPILVL